MLTLLKKPVTADVLRDAVGSLSGYISAVPTPFSGGALDESAFSSFCKWQVEEGIAGLVVNGTTGEAPTLSDSEQARTIVLACAAARGRVPVIAGVGSNDTAHAVALARQAERAGASGLLAVTPYYNRPSQEGLYRHFKAIHDACDLPIILYDVPARTGVSISRRTVEKLAALPRIVGLKDATGNPDRVLRFRRALGERFRLFSGDDATACEFMELGGDGCISVVSNLVPGACVQIHEALRAGDVRKARDLAAGLDPLISVLFADSNPIPLKFALSMVGRMRAELRLPLCEPSVGTRTEISNILLRMGLFPASPRQELAFARSIDRGQGASSNPR